MSDDLSSLPILMTVGEAAKVLRLSQAGMRKLINDGAVHATKIGKRWVINRNEVLRVIEEGTEPIELAGGRLAPRLTSLSGKDEDEAPDAEEQAAAPSGGRRASFDGAPVPRLRVIG